MITMELLANVALWQRVGLTSTLSAFGKCAVWDPLHLHARSAGV